MFHITGSLFRQTSSVLSFISGTPSVACFPVARGSTWHWECLKILPTEVCWTALGSNYTNERIFEMDFCLFLHWNGNQSGCSDMQYNDDMIHDKYNFLFHGLVLQTLNLFKSIALHACQTARLIMCSTDHSSCDQFKYLSCVFLYWAMLMGSLGAPFMIPYP